MCIYFTDLMFYIQCTLYGMGQMKTFQWIQTSLLHILNMLNLMNFLIMALPKIGVAYPQISFGRTLMLNVLHTIYILWCRLNLHAILMYLEI